MESEPAARAAREGIGLCLSGGGFRATLFHLGALRRLNETGILARADLRTVASVSGGSITAAALATAWARLGRAPGTPFSAADWDSHVAAPLRAFTARDVRTGPLLERLLPWNLRRSETTVEALAAEVREGPDAARAGRPAAVAGVPVPRHRHAVRRLVGVHARVDGRLPGGLHGPAARRTRSGARWPPRRASRPCSGPCACASTPPGSRAAALPATRAATQCLSDFRLTDGGAYDNMGLEPVWKGHAGVLVSDAGGLFTQEGDQGLLWRIPRYQGIQERQARALRKRWLIASFGEGTLEGTYWSVGGAAAHYAPDARGYSEALSREVIAEIRTDLDAFSDAEAAVLENHGYLLADAALSRHVPALLVGARPAGRRPAPRLVPAPAQGGGHPRGPRREREAEGVGTAPCLRMAPVSRNR